MKIFVRPTRKTERFNDKDLFIAWVAGQAAGTMRESPEVAVLELLKEIIPVEIIRLDSIKEKT